MLNNSGLNHSLVPVRRYVEQQNVGVELKATDYLPNVYGRVNMYLYSFCAT